MTRRLRTAVMQAEMWGVLAARQARARMLSHQGPLQRHVVFADLGHMDFLPSVQP